jgi:hypothetical protein
MALGGLFDIGNIPLDDPQSEVFLAPGQGQSRADIFVLTGFELSAYPGGKIGEKRTVSLAPGTSAFDVFDMDNDGQGEIVAVQGDEIVLYEAFGPVQPGSPRTLFRQPSQLSEPAKAPFRHVLAAGRPDEVLIVLPRDGMFELYSMEGTLVEAHAPNEGADAPASYGVPFTSSSAAPPEIGLPDALEARVSHVIEVIPDIAGDWASAAPSPLAQRRSDSSHGPDTGDLDADYWPWIPLQTSGDTGQRILYSMAGADYRDTWIRIRRTEARAGAKGESVTVGGKRQYPGALIATDPPPDFDGDGYCDLLLWRTPEPGTSIDSLTRALTEGAWELHLTVHLYDRDQVRYDPKPAAFIACRIPFQWILDPFNEVPLQILQLDDFNGDGRTGLGMSTAPNRFEVWLWKDGFGQPDWEMIFAEPLEGVAFCARLSLDGRSTIGLRTARKLYVLRPSGPAVRLENPKEGTP